MNDTSNRFSAGAARRRFSAALFIALAAPTVMLPQNPQNPAPRQRPRRNVPITDTLRAHELYVSKDPKDLPGCENRCDEEIASKHRSDSIYTARSRSALDSQRACIKSGV